MSNKQTPRNKQSFFYILYPIIIVMIFTVFLNKRHNTEATPLDTNNTTYNQITSETDITTSESQTDTIASESDVPTISVPKIQYPVKTSKTTYPEIRSDYGILIDADNNEIIASKNGNDRIYPASMTKVMTLIVAVENIKDYNDTFTMTYDILAPLVQQHASRAGFEENEKVKIKDLLYGAILPSGADATVALSEYVSGNENEFVKLMNEKAEELGLKNTHFMNTSGLYDSNHYTTPCDMAVIMEYAIKNPVCRKILSTYQYTTEATDIHPEGILLTSNMFAKMYGDEAEGVTILGGKTGYTDEAGQCLVSFAVKDEKTYIAVTTKGTGHYSMIYDAIDLYGKYLPDTPETTE